MGIPRLHPRKLPSCSETVSSPWSTPSKTLLGSPDPQKDLAADSALKKFLVSFQYSNLDELKIPLIRNIFFVSTSFSLSDI